MELTPGQLQTINTPFADLPQTRDRFLELSCVDAYNARADAADALAAKLAARRRILQAILDCLHLKK